MSRKAFRRFVRPLLLSLVVALTPTLAAAVGPVSASSLPGGVVVTDSDSGSGESWGRAGGRTLTFSVNTPAAFSSLLWGISAAPSAAFDGTVTNATGEVMTFNAGESNLPMGVARFNGAAFISLAYPPSAGTLSTRFTLTVNQIAGAAVPLALSGGPASPSINALISGPFRANLLFEMYLPSSLGGPNAWVPLLQGYDFLHTPAGSPPGTEGPAMTGVGYGFVYEMVTAGCGGMPVADHDANVTQRLMSIKDDTAFLRIDTVGRFTGLSQALDQLQQQVSLLPSQFPQIPEFPQLPNDIASSDDVRGAKEELSNMLLILFGLAPCPAEAGPLCTSAIFIQDLATQASVNGVSDALADLQAALGDVATQASVNAVATSVTGLSAQLDDIELAVGAIEAMPIVIEAIEVPDPPSPKHRRWIVKTTQGGDAVSASLSRIVSIRSKGRSPALAEDVTFRAAATAIGPGLLDVVLETGAGNGETVVYQIEVSDGSAAANTIVATR